MTSQPPAPPPPPPPPPPPAGYGQPGAYQARPGNNGLALTSMILGIAGFVFYACGVPSILALVFGYIGRRQIDESGGAQGGRGMAVAGIIMGWIGVGILIVFWTVIIIIAATSSSSSSNSLGALTHLALSAG